jgi:hypothetical protein
MFIVKIFNNGMPTEIHGIKQKLKNGKVVKGINSIDTFSFTLLPSNAGFEKINDFTTLVSVFNTNKSRYEFFGRVLYSDNSMDESGLLTKDVTCESYFGFFCDSQQHYEEEQNWTVLGLLQHIIDTHNKQVEEYKQFTVGEVTVTDPNDNLYTGIQRENTWETLKKKLVEKLGGEIRFRVKDGKTYLDYLTEIGTHRATEIAVSKNMKSVKQERDPSAYVTRLIPLGQKLTREEITKDEEGNEVVQVVETEERLDISSVNGGINYVDDEEGVKRYGLHIAYKEWDDVTDPVNLKNKGINWLADNNKVQVKYSIKALDLSLLGLDVDDFEVCDYYPVKNALLGIDDIARIIKKTVDISEEVNSTIEVGTNFKALSEIQAEQSKAIASASYTMQSLEKNYQANKAIEAQAMVSLIEQSAESIVASVQESYMSKVEGTELQENIKAQLKVFSDQIMLQFSSITEEITEVDGDLQSKYNEIIKYFRFSDDGIVIGASDSAITLMLDNDRINFKKNGVAFGYWDGNDFHTGNIVVDVNERAQFGNFAYIPRADGSLSFLKVGG